MARKKNKKQAKIKQVRLGNKCVFDCRINPITGEFAIEIHGEVANHKDYIFPRDVPEVSNMASAMTMMSLLMHESFRDLSLNIAQNPQRFYTDIQ